MRLTTTQVSLPIFALTLLLVTPVLAQTQAIQGVVLTQEGSPVDSAEVRAFSSSYVDTPSPDTTGPDGRYVINANVATTSTESTPDVLSFRIVASYPNPFGKSARLCTTTPAGGDLKTIVSDMLGRTVIARARTVSAGRHCQDFATDHLAAGPYVFTQQLGTEIRSVTVTHVTVPTASPSSTTSPVVPLATKAARCIDVTIEVTRPGFDDVSEPMCLPLDAQDVDLSLPYALNELTVIVSATSGAGIEEASVSVDVNSDSVPEISAVTGQDGVAELAVRYYGHVTLHVDKPGYAAEDREIFLGEATSEHVLLERLLPAIPASAPITTPTFDGSGQSTHPEVMDMAWELADRGVGGTTWPTGGSGYRYWMWHTPYPYAVSTDTELPSLLVSATGDDGTWALPAGGSDPVFAAPAQGFYADNDAILSPDADTMFVFWKHQQYPAFPFSTLVASYSTDGVTWADTVEVIDFDGDAADPGLAAPAVIYNTAEGHYEMFATRWNTPAGVRRMERWIATDPMAREGDPGGWALQDTLDLVVTQNLGGGAWHADVRYDSTAAGREYRMAVSLREYDDEPMNYCTSVDGIDWTCSVLMEFDSEIPWTADGFYRPTLVPTGGDPGGIPTGYRMWYGGISEANEWRIGETSFALEDTPIRSTCQLRLKMSGSYRLKMSGSAGRWRASGWRLSLGL